MQKTIKNEFQYKLIGIILYFFSSLPGLSILFLITPKNILFNEKSNKDKIKLNLFKNFAREVHENINTSLIKNLTLTEDGISCPENFEPLKVKNQYYGNFAKFYGNKSICIERFNESKYSYRSLLKFSDLNEVSANSKLCGLLIKNSSNLLFISNNMMCPLNRIEITGFTRAQKLGDNFYKMGRSDQYLTPIYGSSSNNSAIVNIEIINNHKVCLEKHNNIKEVPCEFPDNNECFIEDNYEEVLPLDEEENYKLYASNLAKWNLIKNDNINHDFCKKNLRFHILVYGYINFTDNNLKEFEEEFPPGDFTNNSLYKTYEAFKSPNNIDRFFYLLSYNLFIWSLIHFILQLMIYFNKKGIRKLYLINGIILFLFKLLSFFGFIIYYFCFYLKIEKVYVTMIDGPRNKVLKYYSQLRFFFIAKIITIIFFGFIILGIDLLIYTFIKTIQWGKEFKFDEKDLIKEQKINEHNKLNSKNNVDKKVEQNNSDDKLDKESNQFFWPSNGISPNSGQNTKDTINNEQINLIFILNGNISKPYTVKIGKNEVFNKAVILLKEKYSELKGKNMKVFSNGPNVINKDKTITDNGLSDNLKIFII